jgi:peptide/nickel transport system substrate-binding protein
MRWTKVLTVGAALSLGFVAACGAPSTAGDRAGAAVNNAKVDAASASLDPDAQGPAPAVPGARKGGVLTVSYSTVPDNLDPSDQFYQDTSVILNLTHRALTTFMLRDGKMILVPDLATDLGKVSEDGLSWTFTLKDGVKYEDGSPVTAADVAFAIKRSFDKDLAAHGPTYQREFFKGGMAYEGPYTGDKNWQGVEAPDDKTIVINLERRFETLPYFVSFSQFSPIPQSKDKKQDYQLHPLATGTYMFDK